MRYLSHHPDKSLREIDVFLTTRLNFLHGENRKAVIMEFKEWLIEDKIEDDSIWSIPDLTDKILCEFFKRAISKKYK
ncbi:hypothetical protein [Prochlorococcus marinus]|uniref:hypothetical protein n=1 Tax=Prochlorococcus marinus TaxID=1219 RepID=UPI0022B4E752|nr:hypothetical protein [Prochlorococcus marinus]